MTAEEAYFLIVGGVLGVSACVVVICLAEIFGWGRD